MAGLALLAVMLAAALGVGVIQAAPASPIKVTQVATPSPVASGGTLTYAITITNTGGSALTNVTMTDQLQHLIGQGTPPQLSVTSSLGSCTQTAELVTCTTPNLAGRQTWVVTISGVVGAPNGTAINNTVSVTGTRSSSNFTTNSTLTTQVSGGTGGGGGTQRPDLTIGKSGPVEVLSGAPITYTLTVNNVGNAPATGVKVVDTLPAGIGSIAATGTSLFECGVVASTVTCTGGAVNAGANATITITGTVTAAAGAVLTNNAVVDPDNTIVESNELNNTSALWTTNVVAVLTPGPIAIEYTAYPTSINPGAQLEYKILVTNNASRFADPVAVTTGTQGLQASTITATFVLTNGQNHNSNGCSVQGSEVRCQVKRINPGGTLEVTIRGQVIASAGSTIVSTSTATGNIENTGRSATATVTTVVQPSVDLTITKSGSPNPVCAASWPRAAGAPAGEAVCLGGLRYDFVIGNSGTVPATDVVVRDPLPTGTVFDSYTTTAGFTCAIDAADPTPNTVRCTGGTIPAQSTRTLSFVLVAPPSTGMITNTVYVDPDNAITESDETNNTFVTTNQVATGIDLAIAKSDANGFDPIATSGVQTYTITVRNLGTQDASAIAIRDTLPVGTTFLSAIPQTSHGFTCYEPAPGELNVSCDGGALKGTRAMNYPNPNAAITFDTAVITIRVFARPTIGTMYNEVRVDPLDTIAEVTEANNIASETTAVQHGDGTIGAYNELNLVKSQVVPAGSVATNTPVTYRIVVTNTGTDPAVNVTMRDFLPAGFTFIEAADTNPGPTAFLCTEAANVVDCGGATIAGGGGSRTVEIVAFSANSPGMYVNQALVDPSNAIAEGNETNNASSTTTTVIVGAGYIDLQVGHDGTTAGMVIPGGTTTYRLTPSNAGTNPAFNVELRDVLPANTTFVSAVDVAGGDGAFTCLHAAGIVTCSGGALDGSLDLVPGVPTSRTIEITVLAPSDLMPLAANLGNIQHIMTNQASIDPTNAVAESNEINNASTQQKTVRSKINLKTEQEGPTTAQQNQTTTYEITVTNEDGWGGADGSTGQRALGVRVVDQLPVGVIPLSVTPNQPGWVCQLFENPVNFVSCVGDLDPSDPVTITVSVFITASGGSLYNQACVDPDNTIAETNELDNCGAVDTAVVVLLINKAASSANVTVGQALTYTVSLSNGGTTNAPGTIQVVDELPSQVDFVNASATNGFDCTYNSGTRTVSCERNGLPAGANTVVTINTTVNDTATDAFTNTACVGGGIPCASVTVSAGAPAIDLVVAGITDNPDPANRGEELTYTIIALNAGSAPAVDAVVRIQLPQNGVFFEGAAGSNGFVCGAPSASGVVDCTGTFPGGGSTVITVELVVEADAPDTLSLTATADPDGDFAETNEGNNTDTEVTTVTGDLCTNCVDLVAAQIFGTPNPVEAGASAEFRFLVANVGDLPTPHDGTVTEVVISGDYASVGSFSATADFTCADVSSPLDQLFGVTRIRCTGDLDPGEGVMVTVNVTADNDDGSISADGRVLGLVDEFLTSNNGPITSSITVVDP